MRYFFVPFFTYPHQNLVESMRWVVRSARLRQLSVSTWGRGVPSARRWLQEPQRRWRLMMKVARATWRAGWRLHGMNSLSHRSALLSRGVGFVLGSGTYGLHTLTVCGILMCEANLWITKYNTTLQTDVAVALLIAAALPSIIPHPALNATARTVQIWVPCPDLLNGAGGVLYFDVNYLIVH